MLKPSPIIPTEETHDEPRHDQQRLRAARALIDQPEKWTQGASQRNSVGLSVVSDHADVTARCTGGAIRAACVEAGLLAETQVRSHLLDSINGDSAGYKYIGITGWNDKPSRTHAEVMEAFDRAIDDISNANN